MSIWTTILGGAAGFALGGPIGALLGALAGHAVDRLREDGDVARLPPGAGPAADAPAADERANTRRVAFTIGVIALGAKMAKADGVVTRNEVAAFREVFHVPPQEVKNVARVFDMAKRDTRGFETYARQIAGLFEPRSPVLEDLVGGLFHIARADGSISADEIAYLRAVAGIFGFSDTDFARIKATFVGADADDPYAVLGLDAGASEDTVRSTYRRLLREHHPDRVIAQGLPDEFVEIANDRMARINAAYDTIKARRGWR